MQKNKHRLFPLVMFVLTTAAALVYVSLTQKNYLIPMDADL